MTPGRGASAQPEVFVVGSVNIDTTMRLPVLPNRGETVLAHGDAEVSLGGKGANQAVAAARLGAHVRLVCAVGDDDHGRRAVEELTAYGVDVEAGVLAAPTGTAFVMLEAATGENSIVVVPGANAALAHVPSLSPRRGVLLAQCEVPVAVIEQYASAASPGVVRVLNLSPARVPEPELPAVFNGVVVNETEAIALLGAGDPEHLESAARAFARRHDLWIVVTLGPRGVYYFDRHQTIRQDAFAVEVRDTVGAGDAFVGALCVALAESLPIGRALCLASANGALAATRSGAAASMPTRMAVRDALGVAWSSPPGPFDGATGSGT